MDPAGACRETITIFTSFLTYPAESDAYARSASVVEGGVAVSHHVLGRLSVHSDGHVSRVSRAAVMDVMYMFRSMSHGMRGRR